MSFVTKEGIEVKIGQVWKDLDKRMGDRCVKVVELTSITDGVGRAKKVVAKAVVVPCNSYGQQTGTMRTKLSIGRMRKMSTGWELVLEAGA